jgi:hypothetical protein
MRDYNPLDWFWVVGGSETQVYSSAVGDYVPIANTEYQTFLSDGNQPTRIASEIELGEVLADARVRPENVNVLDSFKGRHADKLTLEVVAKILLWLINEVRDLKGQQPITAQQFRNFVKDRL